METSEEDAFNFAVRYLREGRTGPYPEYGYELYLPNIVRMYARELLGQDQQGSERTLPTLSPVFYAAAWELCRRGILRPGVVRFGGQVTDDGNGGNGYSVTPRGREWLKQSANYDAVPTEPSRFARLLASFDGRFGQGYAERSQEAVRCYGALVYLACCAMCGAAAESIVLSLAIAKEGDEGRVLKIYETAGGRNRVENLIVGKVSQATREDFRANTRLLKYWRDTAAHGQASGIGDNEAYTSLAVLLRLAQFANGHWGELTGS